MKKNIRKKSLLRIVALCLAAVTLLLPLTGCTKIVGDNKGAEIDIYLGTKVLNLDPAICYTDENAVKVINLVFEGLMRINSKGKLEKALAKKWEISTDTKTGLRKMVIVINTTYWSDGSLVQANDIVYAWKRILDPEFSSSAVSMLYCIQGARDAKLGKISIDDIGLCALNKNKIEIVFEEGTDIDEFLYNTASPALVPLRENKISLYKDTWSRSSTDLSTNGPFRVRKLSSTVGETMVLERSSYYYLNQQVKTEAIDKFVTPYRIYVHFAEPLDSSVVYSKEGLEDAVSMFNDNRLFYVSGLTPSTLGGYDDKVLKTNKLASVYSYYFNTTRGLLSNPSVRYALSVALDRSYAASLVGCGAEAATGLVPTMIYGNGKTNYRKSAGDILPSGDGLEQARSILAEAGINPSSAGSLELYYIIDDANDSYQSAQLGYQSKEKALALYAESVWEQLGFNIVPKAVASSAYETVFNEGNYDIIGLDIQAVSAYALYMLSPYATTFSGNTRLVSDGDPDFDESVGSSRYYVNVVNRTGYQSEEYDGLIESAFAETNGKAKLELLKQAETLLLTDAPVAPVIFNAETYAVSSELSKVKTDFFGVKIFTKTELKNYQDYLPE